MKDLYTIAEIAAELGLSESTVRYYRDKFAEYIPAIGEGKKRRYRPAALEALRFIAESLRSGKTAEETQQGLNLKFQREIKIAAIAAAEPQQVNFPIRTGEIVVVQAEALERIAAILDSIVVKDQKMMDLSNEMQTLSDEIIFLRKKLDQQDQKIINRLDQLEKEQQENKINITRKDTVIADQQAIIEVKEQKLAAISADAERNRSALEQRERELQILREENTRLKMPFWKRLFFRK